VIVKITRFFCEGNEVSEQEYNQIVAEEDKTDDGEDGEKELDGETQ